MLEKTHIIAMSCGKHINRCGMRRARRQTQAYFNAFIDTTLRHAHRLEWTFHVRKRRRLRRGPRSYNAT